MINEDKILSSGLTLLQTINHLFRLADIFSREELEEQRRYFADWVEEELGPEGKARLLRETEVLVKKIELRPTREGTCAERGAKPM